MSPLSKKVQAAPAVEEQATLETVILRLGTEFFGLSINRILEITKVMEITKVPRSLPFIEGIINLRGRIIPVLDLRKRLGYPPSAYGRTSRIVIVRMVGHRLGLLVDGVTKVAKIPAETVEEVPPETLQIDAEFFKGVGHLDDGLVILLRLDKLLTRREQELLAKREKRKARPAAKQG